MNISDLFAYCARCACGNASPYLERAPHVAPLIFDLFAADSGEVRREPIPLLHFAGCDTARRGRQPFALRQSQQKVEESFFVFVRPARAAPRRGFVTSSHPGRRRARPRKLARQRRELPDGHPGRSETMSVDEASAHVQSGAERHVRSRGRLSARRSEDGARTSRDEVRRR